MLRRQYDTRCTFCKSHAQATTDQSKPGIQHNETPLAADAPTITVVPGVARLSHPGTIDSARPQPDSANSAVTPQFPNGVVVLGRSSARGSQPQLLGEIRALLRHRLMTSCLPGGGAWFLIIAFCFTRADSLLNTDVLGATCMKVMLAAAVAIPVGGLLLYFWRSISPGWLRTFEVALFGASAVAMAWLRFAMYAHVLDDGFPAVAAHHAIAFTAALGSIALFSLIVVHAVFIPNTWCNTLRMATAMVLVNLGAEVLVWRAHPAAFAEHFATPLVLNGLTLILGLGTSVLGSYKIGELRNEAVAAQRQLRALGQYQLKESLGSGGMGEVYLAEHRFLKRPCAIKLIRQERAGDPNTLARFEREVQATAQLTHPNTIEIFDYGRTDDGTLYYVMEYLDGISLDELVRREGPLPPLRAVYLARQICGALAEAHAQGLVHRDIKPSNVVVCRRGGIADVAKLVDFGLVGTTANRGDGTLTLDGNILGTPEYMSPEQATDAALVDARSDIYSLGCLLYFMLTGQPPFVRKTVIETLIAHRQEPAEPLRSRGIHAPAPLEAAVARCLQKDPADRFDSVTDLQEALKRVCLGRMSAVPTTV